MTKWTVEQVREQAQAWRPERPQTADMLDAFAAAFEAQTWRPIETAPKDGTWILCWMHHGGKSRRPVVLHWSNAWSGVDGDDYQWSDDDYAVGGVTHWQPLPPAPRDDEPAV